MKSILTMKELDYFEERGRIVVLGKLFWVDNCTSSSGWGPNCYTWNDWHLTSQTHSVKKTKQTNKKKNKHLEFKKNAVCIYIQCH